MASERRSPAQGLCPEAPGGQQAGRLAPQVCSQRALGAPRGGAVLLGKLAAVGECSRPVLSDTAAISHVSPLSARKGEISYFILLPLVAGSTGLAPPWPGGAVEVLWERPWALLPLTEEAGLTSPAEGQEVSDFVVALFEPVCCSLPGKLVTSLSGRSWWPSVQVGGAVQVGALALWLCCPSRCTLCSSTRGWPQSSSFAG